jgi:hypothetical protein
LVLLAALQAALQISSCQICRKEAAFISLHELYRHFASRKGISLGCSSSRIADFKLPDMQEGSGLHFPSRTLQGNFASRKGISLGCSSSRITDFELPDMQEGSGLTGRNSGMMAPQCISV